MPSVSLKEYMENVLFLVDEYTNTNGKGYVVIQTKDIRIGSYLEPVAKRLVDNLEDLNNKIKLKEIIVVTTEPNAKIKHDELCKTEGSLKIVHQYLLVYKAGGVGDHKKDT